LRDSGDKILDVAEQRLGVAKPEGMPSFGIFYVLGTRYACCQIAAKRNLQHCVGFPMPALTDAMGCTAANSLNRASAMPRWKMPARRLVQS
jgi:hypothetical protein